VQLHMRHQLRLHFRDHCSRSFLLFTSVFFFPPGLPVTGWTPDLIDTHIWHATLPKNTTYFRSLWADGDDDFIDAFAALFKRNCI
jgi:hypothetical protein